MTAPATAGPLTDTREMLVERIAQKFGADVLETVLAVTHRRSDDDGVELSSEDRKAAYAEQISALVEAGADLGHRRRVRMRHPERGERRHRPVDEQAHRLVARAGVAQGDIGAALRQVAGDVGADAARPGDQGGCAREIHGIRIGEKKNSAVRGHRDPLAGQRVQ